MKKMMRGESVVYIKEQLGHSSIKVTIDLCQMKL